MPGSIHPHYKDADTVPDLPVEAAPAFTCAADIVRVATFCREHFPERVWFRGHSNAEWSLVPSVLRGRWNDEEVRHLENNLLYEFKRLASSRRTDRPQPDDFSAWMILAQHYRVPTRLLDWTESLLVATYFAVCDGNTDVPGAVWAMNPLVLNLLQLKKAHLLTQHSAQVREQCERVFSGDGVEAWNLIALQGDQFDARLSSQSGVFTLHGHDIPLEAEDWANRKFLLKFTIPPAIKSDLAAALEVFGVSGATVFPDLENLGLHLASKYMGETVNTED